MNFSYPERRKQAKIRLSCRGRQRTAPPAPPAVANIPATLGSRKKMTQVSPASADAALHREVAELIVAALNLETSADEIETDAPLYGEGLGLDSIDILEVALVVSKRYGFSLRADNEDNLRIFSSLRSLCDHIAANRTQ
jgi:acyl carrier protein